MSGLDDIVTQFIEDLIGEVTREHTQDDYALCGPARGDA